MKDKHYTKEDVVQSHARQLRTTLHSLKEIEDSNHKIYEDLAKELGSMVAVATEQYPGITLEEYRPVTQIFIKFRNEYLGKL